MSNETVARRYGTALADVVLKTGETENVKAELKIWEEMMASNPDLQTAFGNPSIAHSGKERLLESLIQRANPSRTTANFLRILVKNDRLTELAEINDKFASVLEERSGRVTAEVTSARDLSEGQKQELRMNLERLTGKQVDLRYGIDPSIIGGVVTRIGSTIYDGSVKTQLENLKEQLVNG